MFGVNTNRCKHIIVLFCDVYSRRNIFGVGGRTNYIFNTHRTCTRNNRINIIVFIKFVC